MHNLNVYSACASIIYASETKAFFLHVHSEDICDQFAKTVLMGIQTDTLFCTVLVAEYMNQLSKCV